LRNADSSLPDVCPKQSDLKIAFLDSFQCCARVRAFNYFVNRNAS
jgi:hypothetical protein